MLPIHVHRKYGNASILASLEAKYPLPVAPPMSAPGDPSSRLYPMDYGGGGSQHSLSIPVEPSWFSDVVFPVVVVGAVVVVALFALIVLLLVRRHFQLEAEGHPIDEDRSALTPSSIRRPSPAVLRFEIGGAGSTASDLVASDDAATDVVTFTTASSSGSTSCGTLPHSICGRNTYFDSVDQMRFATTFRPLARGGSRQAPDLLQQSLRPHPPPPAASEELFLC